MNPSLAARHAVIDALASAWPEWMSTTTVHRSMETYSRSTARETLFALWREGTVERDETPHYNHVGFKYIWRLERKQQ